MWKILYFLPPPVKLLFFLVETWHIRDLRNTYFTRTTDSGVPQVKTHTQARAHMGLVYFVSLAHITKHLNKDIRKYFNKYLSSKPEHNMYSI